MLLKFKSLENKYIGKFILTQPDLANFYKKQVVDFWPWDATSPGIDKRRDSNSSWGGSKGRIVGSQLH